MEEWKKIDGYENYSVSSEGRVRNDKTGRILKVTPDKGGYLQVCLSKNGKQKTFNVHRLVAETFIPSPENKSCVDHINTIRDDNRVENLRWATHKENSNNPLTLEHKSGEKHPMYGRTGENSPQAKRIILINTGEVFNFIKQAEEKYNVHWQNISACCRGKRKSAGKHPETNEPLIWRYYEKEEE